MEDVIVSRYPNVINVSAVEPIGGFKVRVTFSDRTQREIDLEKYLYGPIFEPIRDNSATFGRVYVDHGAVAWPNGADIDTDTLYYDGAPPWATDEAEPAKPPVRSLSESSPALKSRSRKARRATRRSPKPTVKKKTRAARTHT